MIKATVEYVGFRSSAQRREYLLRSHIGPETREYTIGIAHSAFAARRARFQDGPEICYLRLMKELEAAENAAPGAHDFTITDAELIDYLTRHTAPARRSFAVAASSPPPAPNSATEGSAPAAPPRRH
jgi:hypothetical protein